MAVCAVWLLLPTDVLAAPKGVEQITRLASAMIRSRAHLEADPTVRRLFEVGHRNGVAGMTVIARDLDTYAQVGSVRVPDSLSAAGGMLSAVDGLRHRLYVLYPSRPVDDSELRAVIGENAAAGTTDEFVRAYFGIAVIDTIDVRLIGSAVIALLQPAVPQDRAESNLIGVKAMSYFRDGGRDLLYLASEIPVGAGNLAVSNHTVTAHQISVDRLLDPDVFSAVDWSFPLPQCALVMARDIPGVIFRSSYSATLSIPCRQGGAQGIVAGQPLETPGVVQLAMDAGSTPSDTSSFETRFIAISGNLQYGIATVDPETERMFLQIDGSNSEAGVWVFDVPHSSFIGLIVLPQIFAAGGTVTMGIDVARGRLYALSKTDTETGDSQVVVASVRGVQVDQGQVVPLRTSQALIKRRPVIDPLRQRIFLEAGEASILVVQDHLRMRSVPDAEDPDSNTLDVDEVGRARANYVGGAAAYGARVRFVGGSRGVERNVNTYLENPPSFLFPATGGITPPPPSEGTRDLHLGRVSHSTLANAEASAKATGGQRDLENTDADAANFAGYIKRWGGPDLSSQRWPYPETGCTDFGGPDDARKGAVYGASVTCDVAGKRVTALAVDESYSHGEVLRIAQSRARTALTRDAKRGIVSVAEAEVFGVDLGGRAGIGRLITHAETWATGRPKSSNRIGAGSMFSSTFEDVWVADDGGGRTTVCGKTCDPDAVASALNRALGLRARVEVPRPEPTRAKGTDGGFEALIVRDPFERANESSVNEEVDDRRLEVPGLIVTVFADGRVPSRVVISLAAVAAESHYGIYLLSQGVSFRPRPSLPPEVVYGPDGEPIPSVAPPTRGPGIPSFVKKTYRGLKVILASPVAALRLAGIWMILGGPIALMRRRRVADQAAT